MVAEVIVLVYGPAGRVQFRVSTVYNMYAHTDTCIRANESVVPPQIKCKRYEKVRKTEKESVYTFL